MLGITLILFVCIFPGISKGYNYEIKFIQQKVDHFGYSNNDYFKQRYLVNSDFYKQDQNFIFFYTGNEGDIEMFAANTGFIWENAVDFGALIVFAEHRYYGQSLPYGNLSFTDNKYLGYLTSEQALADFATLIDYLQEIFYFNKKANVVAVGGSYGGMLAAWMRIKYPHHVFGAIASSAPVWQFNGLTKCETFAQIVTQNFAREALDCSKAIRKSWSVIRSLADESSGKKFLAEAFHFCQSYESFDVNEAIQWLSDTWSYLAMCNYPYSTSFLRPLPSHPVKEACYYLNSSVGGLELVKNIVKAASVFHNYTGDVKCNNFSNSIPLLGENGWNYQACTEIVQPMCQNGMSDMFEPAKWDFEAYSESCFKKYGVKPDLNKAVLIYGGKNINDSSKIIFTNGLLDPWSGGGVLETISECNNCGNCLLAYTMDDAAHHLDLRSANDEDPDSVKSLRKEILGTIGMWNSRN